MSTSQSQKPQHYACVNCQQNFQAEDLYMQHYKSQHHRYNIKRKLIGLPPLSFEEYHIQFQDQKTSKNSVEQDFYCEICSKKFISAGTYKQHIGSKKHRHNREQLKAPEKYQMSKSSSSSDFEIIGAEKAETCLFCQSEGTQTHMKAAHNFPPFEHECTNYEGLVHYLRAKIGRSECVYCGVKFACEEGARQHMADVGHGKLDIENFGQFEKFYLWKILETSSSEEEQELGVEKEMSPQKQQVESVFEELNHPTLSQLQQKRLSKIKFTPTGAIINGKEVGYRHLKQYYKQYLNREIVNMREKYQPAIESDFKSEWKLIEKVPVKVPKVHGNVNTR